MSNPGDIRDLLASAAVNGLTLLGYTVDIHEQDSATAVTNGSDLKALVREPSNKEAREFDSLFENQLDLVIEIPKQGSFLPSIIKQQQHKIKYGGVFYEINDVRGGGPVTSTDGEIERAVAVCFCSRLADGPVGAGVGI